MKEEVKCPKCGKLRTRYIKCSNLCQNCYRELLEKYCYFNYKDSIVPKKDSNVEKICTFSVKYNLRAKDIIELHGKELHISNIAYVNTIINKYLYKCDTYGNKRPDYMEKIIDE